MSRWPAVKAGHLLRALLRIGWTSQAEANGGNEPVLIARWLGPAGPMMFSPFTMARKSVATRSRKVAKHTGAQAGRVTSGGDDWLAPDRAIKIAAPRRVLVREVNWLGDVVMSLPALGLIRRAWPGAHLSVLCKRELAGFFDGARWIDEVIPYSISRGLRGYADTARIVSRIRAGRFDLAILLPESFSAALWVTLAGVKNRAGYAADLRGPLLTHKSVPAADAARSHQMYRWLAMLRGTLAIDGDAGLPAQCRQSMCTNLIAPRCARGSRRGGNLRTAR